MDQRTEATAVANGQIQAVQHVATFEADGVVVAGAGDGICVRRLDAPGTLADPCAWVAAHRDLIIEQMRDAGAVLLRGFGFETADMFERVATHVAGSLMEHREQSVYRNRVQHLVFTSTAYPADQTIFVHNEHSYSLTFPTTLAFWCDVAPAMGGETTIVDTRKVLRRIAAPIREKFASLGYLYCCNVRMSAALTDAEALRSFETYCTQEQMTYEWKSATHVRTSRARPTTIRHPYTGELSWFNHVAFAHPSTLPDAIRSRVLAAYGDEGVPTISCYGNGSSIEQGTLDALRAAYTAETIAVSWQHGDVLLLDNIAVAHGRRPYTGKRRVLVALGDPYTRPTE